MKGGEKRSKWPVHENESKFQSQTSQGRRKRKERAKTTGAQLFSFSSFLLFSFCFWFGESSKARFLRDCATIRVSQVKSSQTRRRAGRAERERQEREREREAGVVCTCARISVRMFLCVCVNVCTKVDLGWRRYAVCICSKRPFPPPPK